MALSSDGYSKAATVTYAMQLPLIPSIMILRQKYFAITRRRGMPLVREPYHIFGIMH